eukprot:TRINITY_DN3887_c0_g1_i2.p2 TRINITY_DN3887_c0_g1~~TRINITY_DN3887_c0_g1_i2.p2  ORF type:complete len:269 (+),score=65.62 TRINITY_DN3887_c0_g1_i2:16-822(+)
MSLALVRAALAPTGVLRVGINMSNFLLVSIPSPEPNGVVPALAQELGRRLEVEVQLIPFEHPHALCNAAADDVWDVAFVGADPARAKLIEFTAPYAEIPCTYMVPVDSTVQTPEDADSAGFRIAVKAGAAYHLWLQRNIEQAELVAASTINESCAVFEERGLEVLSGLRSKLAMEVERTAGKHRLLERDFMTVEQAAGCLRSVAPEGAVYLKDFVEDVKASGLVLELFELYKVDAELQVAPLATAGSDAPQDVNTLSLIHISEPTRPY